MLKPLPMQHVTLYMLREEAAAAALLLAGEGVFAPRQEEVTDDALPESPAIRYRDLFAAATRRLDKILAYTGLTIAAGAPDDGHEAIPEETLARINDDMGEIWRVFSGCEEAERRLAEQQRQVEQLSQALTEYEALDVDLGLLQGRLRFLEVHLGTVSSVDVVRLREAVGLLGYSLTLFKETDGTAHVVLAGLAAAAQGLDRVLRAASFRPVPLPPEFHEHPRQLREELAARRRRIDEELRDNHRAVEQAKERHGPAVRHAAGHLARAAPYSHLAEMLRASGGLVRVSGWVPADRVDALQSRLAERFAGRVLVQARTPAPEERLMVPSAFRYPRWLQPFADLVRGYGIPRYGEVDPTWLFALTFVAMFGMMFGDAGQGAVIVVGGLLLPPRWRGYAPFVVTAGLSSLLFGLLYGSVFGAEILTPVWLSPLSNPVYMLKVAIWWGIGFILLANLITVRNRLAEGRYREMLLDPSGGVGTLFYLGLVYAGYRLLGDGQVGWPVMLWVAAPLSVLLGRIWVNNPTSTAERILIVAVEGFETVMRYISNTLSFLRVAAFSLNHVALAVAIYMLAGMMGATGHWVTVVAGNVIILVLEGGIVAIQVLRLEYYEGFSRYFSGDGRAFRPLTLGRQAG